MKLVILGNGISGITAARYVRKNSNCDITIISAESPYFYSRTALMYIYMGHMRFEQTMPYEPSFWQKNKINLIQTQVDQIDFDKKELITKDARISYDKLILALGSKPNKFGWPGQDLQGVGGLYSLQDLERIEKYTKQAKRVTIVGGGLIGIELAEMCLSRNIPVSFLVRESSYWNKVLPPEESQMVVREIQRHGVDLRLETELQEILDNGQGQCAAVITNRGERIDCDFVGLTAGVHPNVDFLRETKLDVNKGIRVNNYLETNIQDVYAIGDCAELQAPAVGRRSIEAIWYTGRMMGEVCAYNLLGKKIPYKPGIWFNSAKFFDIEYQVYGRVQGPGISSYYWEDKSGKKSIRLAYDAENKIKGFNVMGIRFRHEVCATFIKNKTDLSDVIRQLSLADFDSELYKNLVRDFQEQFGQKAKSGKRAKRSLNQVLKFLKKS